MKSKVLIFVILAAGIVGVGLIRTVSKSRNQKKVPNNNQIQWHIQEAKNQGLKKVSIPAPTADYQGSGDSDIAKALSQYTVVVAEPTEFRTYDYTPNDLITWQKFRTLETLTDIRPPQCFECNSLSPPPDLLPLLAGEFLVPRQGGTIQRDGVELTQSEPSFPPFERGQKYLMLISLYPSGLALTAGGPVGVFRISENGKLAPLTDEPHQLRDGIKNKYKDSLDEVRIRIKKSL